MCQKSYAKKSSLSSLWLVRIDVE